MCKTKVASQVLGELPISDQTLLGKLEHVYNKPPPAVSMPQAYVGPRKKQKGV